MEETTTQTEVVSTRRKLKKGEYISTVGRRKSSTAQVRLTPSSKRSITVNGKPFEVFFSTEASQKAVLDAFVKAKTEEEFSLSVLVKGGGVQAQAEATRHGIARALTRLDAGEFKLPMKKAGFLKRDPRRKERKKFGLRGARRAPQWSKR